MDPAQALPAELGRSRVSVALFVAIAGLVAAAYLAFLTPSGLLATPDSIAYVGAAENIANGKGLTLPFAQPYAEIRPARAWSVAGTAPLAQYFPGFSLVLSVPVAAGVSPGSAAHVFNVVMGGITVAMVAWGALALSRRSLTAAFVAVLLFVTTRSFALSFSGISTEALFVPLCLGALGALAFLLRRWSVGVAAVFIVLAGAASLTRFVGITLAATAVIALMVQPTPTLLPRVRRALVVGLLAASPGLVWQLYKVAGGGTGGSGAVVYHPPSRAARGLLDVAATWINGRTKLLSGLGPVLNAPTLVVFAALVLIVAFVGATSVRTRPSGERSLRSQLVLVGVTFCILYIVILWLTVALLVKATTFADERMLLPVLPVALVLVVSAIAGLLRWAWNQPTALRTVAVVGVLVLAIPVLIWHANGARGTIKFQRSSAARPHSRSVSERAPLYQYLSKLPADVLIFTNDPFDVWNVSRRFVASLPLRFSPWTGKLEKDFSARLAEIAPALCRHGGLVIYYPRTSVEQPTAAELTHAGLVFDKRYPNAATYLPACSGGGKV